MRPRIQCRDLPKPRTRTQALLRRGGAAATGRPNAELVPMLEGAAGDEDAGQAVFVDDAALSGLCTRLLEVRGEGELNADPPRTPRPRPHGVGCLHQWGRQDYPNPYSLSRWR
jgi:hypothetical protein